MSSAPEAEVVAAAAASTSSAASENKETTVIEMVMVQTKSLQTVKIEFSDSARPYDPEAAAEGDAKDDSVTVVPAAVLPAMMQAVKIKEEPRDEDEDVQVVEVKVR